LPQGCCLEAKPWLLAIETVADLTLFGAFCAIAFAVWRFLRPKDDENDALRKRDEPASAFPLSAPSYAALLLGFLLLCGLSHLVRAIGSWRQACEIEGLLNVAAAIAAIPAGVLSRPTLEAFRRREAARRKRETDLAERMKPLAAGGARLETLALTSSAVFWTANAEGQVVEPSRMWGVFTGQTDGEQLGEGWLDALHPDDQDRVREAWRKAVSGHRMFETEYRVRHVTGYWRWMASKAAPPLADPDVVREWVGMNEDITERKRAEETLRRQTEHFAAIVAAAPDGFLLLDNKGRVREANEAYGRMTGYTRDTLLSRRLADLDCAKKDEADVRYINEIIRNGFGRFETRHRTADGQFINVEVSAVYWRPTNRIALFIRDKRSQMT
jgi:PAS domain S-box-containing protein